MQLVILLVICTTIKYATICLIMVFHNGLLFTCKIMGRVFVLSEMLCMLLLFFMDINWQTKKSQFSVKVWKYNQKSSKLFIVLEKLYIGNNPWVPVLEAILVMNT